MKQLRLAALVALCVHVSGSAAAQDADLAIRVEREVERLARESVFWPGFDPLAIPLAVYTGERTYLFRHPAPPAEFTRVAGGSEAFTLEGRFPAVTSNTSAEIGGTVTATLLADGVRANLGATELAATALHEAFHVYQRRRHPGWVGNEGDLFLYPTDDSRLLGLRRLESAALRKALDASTSASAACWVGLALRYRDARFSSMDSAFSTYERRTELNEGLATYVQLRAAGRTTVEIPAAEFAATDVRTRIYSIGPALAFLLDRLQPGWQAGLEANDALYLEGLIRSAIEAGGPVSAGSSCALPPDETTRIERSAQQDVAAVVAARGERRNAFDASPGWRIVIEAADGQPLWPQGFDPLNIERVEGGYLHTRFLRLGNDAGQMQGIDEAGVDISTLTEAVGPHPLFNGVRRVTVVGLARPEVQTVGGQASIKAPGFTANFKNARVQVGTSEVRIVLVR